MGNLSTSKQGNLLFVAVLTVCAALSTQYHFIRQANIEEAVLARYVAESETRHARILGSMGTRRQVLDAMVAFFEASNDIDVGEFERFGQHLLMPGGVVAMCWTGQGDSGRFQFALEGYDASRLCGHFELLEPSRLVSQERPVIILSSFASTSGQNQSGSVSIVFELKSLSLEEPVEGMSELLLLNDSIQNTVETYSFGEDKLVLAERGALAGHSVKLLPLSRFGHTDFVYLTRRDPLKDMPFDPVWMALLLLSLSGALLVRNLIVRREAIEAEVEVRTSELSQFAYRTSHDLRSPLVSVGGLCRAVREDLEDGDLEEVEANVARIERLVGRLDALVGDILTFTRADLSRDEVEPVVMASVLEEVIERIGDTYMDHGVDIELDLKVERAFLFPRGRIQQVFENLISNSIKYANPEAGRRYVRVSAVAVGRVLEITIADNGLGIPEKYHGRLFKMFERFHPEASKVGSGLGLSIVKKHVDRLNGDIGLTSDSKGTTIVLKLPIKRRKAS